MRRDDTFYDRACAQVARQAPMTEAEERRLAQRWRTKKDRAAAEALVRAHLHLVPRLARRLRGYGVPREELIAEGNLGLLRAVEQFDLRGVRFSTYATYWIRAFMLSFVMRQKSVVTRGTGAVGAKLFFKLRGARARAEALLGPGHPDIFPMLAQQFGLPEEQLRAHAARLDAHDASLDAKVGEDGDATLLDLTPCPAATPEALISDVERDERVRGTVNRVWKALDERERAVLQHRLLDDDAGVTLSDLGSKFRLSRERLRQIELRLKGRLRHALDASGLAEAG